MYMHITILLMYYVCTSFLDDGGSGSNDHSNLSLSEVLAGAGAEDSVFQQLAQSKDLLDGLEFPIDTLSQLPATPPRHRDGTTANLPPSSAVSEASVVYAPSTFA